MKRFEPRIGYRYSLIFPRNRAQSALTRGFVSLLHEELQALQQRSTGLFDVL